MCIGSFHTPHFRTTPEQFCLRPDAVSIGQRFVIALPFVLARSKLASLIDINCLAFMVSTYSANRAGRQRAMRHTAGSRGSGGPGLSRGGLCGACGLYALEGYVGAFDGTTVFKPLIGLEVSTPQSGGSYAVTF